MVRSALEWLALQSGIARVVPAVARPLVAGTASAVPDCSTNHDSADRISGQFLFYHDHNFTKSKGNLHFRRLVPLFVPIGVCVTMQINVNLKATKNFEVMRFSFGHVSLTVTVYDRKRAVVWPWLMLELSTFLALTQLGIRQSDWWRAGIRSTNLHTVVEWVITSPIYYGCNYSTMP